MDAIEANLLLTRAALVDGRQPTKERAEVWADVLRDLSFHDAVEALDEFRRTREDWLQPVHLIQIAKLQRERRYAEDRRREQLTATRPEPPPPLTREQKVALNETYRAGRIAARLAQGITEPLPASDVMFRNLDGPDDSGVISEGDFALPE